MKKGLLLAILALFTSVALVGCGQKAEEQTNDDNQNTTVTDTQNNDGNPDDKKDENKTEDKKDENQGDQNANPEQSVDLGEKTIEGESVEGTIYGTGKYRLTKASDRVVVEWAKDTSKNKIEYIFNNDKLSAIRITASYENEEQAKSTYDTIAKNENAKKGLKDIKVEGNSIIYDADESQWAEIKDYNKDQVFEEQKKTLEELSKVDDIKSDD